MDNYQETLLTMLLALLLAFMFLLWTVGLVSPIRAITDTSLMCRQVYLAPAGRPDSIPCSSEIDERCMEYHKKGSL